MRKTTLLLLILINLGIMNKAYSWSSDYNRPPTIMETPVEEVVNYEPPTVMETPLEEVVNYEPPILLETPLEEVVNYEPPTIMETPLEEVVNYEPPNLSEDLSEPLIVEIVDPGDLYEECLAKAEELQKLMFKYDAYNEQIKRNNSEISDLMNVLAQGQHLSTEEVLEMEVKIKRLEIENKAFQEWISDYNKKREELRSTCSILNTTPTEYPTQILDPFNPPFTECQKKLREMDNKITLKEAEYKSFVQMIASLSNDLAKLVNSTFAGFYQDEINRLEMIINDYSSRLSELALEIVQIKNEAEDLKLECAD